MSGTSGPGIVDLHSHLVPGVDDGAPTLEDALEGIDRMVGRGVTHLVTTPHLDASLVRDSSRLAEVLDAVDRAFVPVVEMARERHPALRLERAHEVKLDLPNPDLSEPRLRLPGTDVVLVEWPGLQIPPRTTEALEGIMAGGVRPLLAHPERYRRLEAYPDLPLAWKEAGAWLVVNHGSVVGRYGKEAQRNALHLLARGWVDALATDFHGRPHLSLYLERSRRWFEARGAGDAWRFLVEENPARIARGEAPLSVPPVQGAEGLLSRLRSALGGGR
jgi:protein-tyrosine phosphatase